LLYAIFGTIIGSIAVKIIKYKQKELFYIGFSLILTTAPWYSGGISFLIMTFFDFILIDSVCFIINYGLIVASLLDTTITVSITSLAITRSLLMGRIVFSYLGWLLPDRIAKWLIKE